MTDRETILATCNAGYAAMTDAELFAAATLFGFVIETRHLASVELGKLTVLRFDTPAIGGNVLERAIAEEIDVEIWNRWERFSEYAMARTCP